MKTPDSDYQVTLLMYIAYLVIGFNVFQEYHPILNPSVGI